MKKLTVFFLLFFAINLLGFSQNTVKGVVIDGNTGDPILSVRVSIKNTEKITLTDVLGVFLLDEVPAGDQMVLFSFDGYEEQNFPVSMQGATVDLGTIFLYPIEKEDTELTTVTITDDELNSDDGFTDNLAGLLQSSRDAFLSAAAFDFSATFFRPRGLDNANGKVLINGIEMNKFSNNRPQWANWGGMNDLQRDQVFTQGVSPNEFTFGDIGGVNHINMRASSFQAGGRVSYAMGNRSYRGQESAPINANLNF